MDLKISEIYSFIVDSIYVTFNTETGGISFAQVIRFTQDFDIGTRFKMISLIVSLSFIAIIVLLIIKARKIHVQKIKDLAQAINPPRTKTQPGPLLSKWGEITRHIDSHKELEWKFAVIEADKLLDELLKSMGYPGETMGERLMSIDRSKLASLNHLWEAHKIRNKIVHEPDYFLRHSEAQMAIQGYERALEELYAIS
jgi:hypothetical protein